MDIVSSHLSIKLNTADLKQLAKITRTELSAGLRKLNERGSATTALEYILGGNSSAQQLLPRSLIFLMHRMYGADTETIHSQLQRLTSMCDQFVELYGDGPLQILRAPARINIMGEHIDYVSYLPTASLPFGSREHDMLMLYRGSETNRVRGSSTLNEYSSFAFTFAEGPTLGTSGDAEADWLSYLYEHDAPVPHWSNYVKGAAFFARINYGVKAGFDFVVDSAIPAGGGASSSSALVVLASAAVRDVNRLEYSPMDLARDAARAEWYVGTRGGSMDHITICLAEPDQAVLISYLDQKARHIPLPGRGFRWVTFFSQPADKGRAVMIEYNERAAISRILIPAVIEGWKTKHPERHVAWLAAVQLLQAGSAATLAEIETLLHELPCTLTLKEVQRNHPEAFSACARSFPALIAERSDMPLQLRSRALHHAGEVRRVATAVQVLENSCLPQSDANPGQHTDAAMRELGHLFNQSHDSLRDLYDVSTPEVERLVEIIVADKNVYGARLMGGGFGGNVLALTNEENVPALIDRVQEAYYKPRNREGVSEGSVMISTPGDGLATIDVESVRREAIEEFNASDHASTTRNGLPRSRNNRARLNALLDRLTVDGLTIGLTMDKTLDAVWPVIVAAGKGTRMRATGFDIPKPLAAVLGTPSIIHVLRNVRTAFGTTRPPIVIVSPETEAKIRESLAGDEVTFVVQQEALGTGDAVLSARQEMLGFPGRALVIWSTQPVIRPETMQRTLKLARLFQDYEMVLPTVHQDRPYAPLLRDERGRVRGARETHLEQAERPDFGESNIGMFLVKSESMFNALGDLHRIHWNDVERRYQRHGGELGFPNEMINYFATQDAGVFACPIADSREEQGIKRFEDVARCEQFISALAQETS